MNHFFKVWIRPRLFYLAYFPVRTLLILYKMVRSDRSYTVNGVGPSRVCIEAGTKGWESIEFKEILVLTKEYLDEHRVVQHVVDRDKPYVRQVRGIIHNEQLTHYVYDPRTGSQHWFWGVVEAVMLAFIFFHKRITPVVLLSDLAVRTWRAQAAIVTAVEGVTVCFMSPRLVRPIFPHHRLLGPSVMPLSAATVRLLEQTKSTQYANPANDVIFIGSLYEPRTTILNEIAQKLSHKGITLDIAGRKLGTMRKPDSEYWGRMMDAKIVITTADQMSSPDTDWTWVPHMLYRYIEVLACGSLLIAPDVPGVRRYFVPDQHFIPFVSPDDAAEKVARYLADAPARERIAKAGFAKAKSLVDSRTFWSTIDAALSHRPIA